METTAAPTPRPKRARAPRPLHLRPRPRRRPHARGTRTATALVALAVTGALLAGCTADVAPDALGPSPAALPVHASGSAKAPRTTPHSPPTSPTTTHTTPHDASRTKGLDPELRRRFDVARSAAAKHGLSLTITSGRRTVAQQEALIKDAVEQHGSVTEAHKYVLPPERSAHVAGTAIDVGGQKAAAWLADHETAFGLCRTYANEWWHFELVGAVGETCPAMHPDSSGGWDGVDAG
ncbi:M15 family metallopeptidase [Cellulomonas alba]|uniref:M15 family metallopeptidase n=1 Tax=Cellulomonas alba TaxID=3053467 RepID=A0ABT7SLI8_9CELL|nr:M15 family metallopeptidase [Cellulomonas alba]MDM7856427.1 M15 family metallopeptidase [Cellulomonas alba]